jgi:GH24 family phage-related lysozyme (muramidase)
MAEKHRRNEMSFNSALRRARLIIIDEEKPIDHMYLDSVNKVTVAVGHMMPDAASAARIKMYHYGTNAVATDLEKKTEWNAMRKLSNGLPKNNKSAGYYKASAKLFVTTTEVDTLLDADLAKSIRILRANYPKFDTFPEDAQVAMIDMAYNLGNRIHSKFKTFTAVINNPKGPNWELAAKNSNRPQLSPKRNKEVRDLFMPAHYWETTVKPALNIATAAARAVTGAGIKR